MLIEFAAKHKLAKEFIHTARKWYMPLADQISRHHDGAKKTFYVGLNGSQGSGKSTLADFLKIYLRDKYQLNVTVLSLDDFYLDQSQRLALSQNIHPLFKTRGVPGTHNMLYAKKLLFDLSQHKGQLVLPKFDKAKDNPAPIDTWPTTLTPVDVVIFEGWCWGVTPQDAASLRVPVNELERLEDQCAVWRNYVNKQLATQYQPLYEQMDFWLMIKAPSFADVFTWRLEQEKKLIASTLDKDARGLMNESQIARFIQYYQRLTQHGLDSLPGRCNLVFELDSARRIVSTRTRKFNA